MTTPRQPPPRRVWRVALLAVTGAAIAGAAAVYVDRRLRAAPPDQPSSPPPPDKPAEQPARRPERRLWIVAGTAVLVAAAITVTVVTRSPGDTSVPVVATPTPTATTAMRLVDCQFAIAAATGQNVRTTCGYPAGNPEASFREQSADRSDPRFFGAALPDALATDSAACVVDTPAPKEVDIVYPTLSASFVQVPGLRRIEPTFQLTEANTPVSLTIERAGSPIGPGQQAELSLRLIQPLEQGKTYMWRVKGTPQDVAAGDWSPWCLFTVAEETRDDLGLADEEDYQVTIPVAGWRTVLRAQRPDEAHLDPIADAAGKKSGSAAVSLTGAEWTSVITRLASQASLNDEPEYWEMVDTLSSALGGHPHPTMGLPRDTP
ncbi:hypothetical protein [Actinoplanes sp. NPDC026670]|uniref:hypothetical protein n=1 Tax=Actinoplanes sp. NPDC026670 TaxID=3154700 RepID=UPI0033E56028